MGNKSSTDNTAEGKEMSNSETFAKPQDQDSLPPLKDLDLECSELKEMVDELSEAIEDIFEDRDEQDDSNMNMESKLQTMTRNIQLQIHRLHKHLERHSKLVSVGNNSQLMLLVKELVSIVNNYMNMLLRNIRKLRQSLEEKELGGQKGVNLNLRRKRVPEQVDVIPEQLDVDTMLMELAETESTREGLESDIVTVLVFWRDYRELVDMQDDTVDYIEQKVRQAAPAISGFHVMARERKT